MSPITPLPQDGEDGEYLPIKRGKHGPLGLFDVSKVELDLIEAGLDDTPIKLAFATFSLSLSVTCFTTEKHKWEMLSALLPGGGAAFLLLAVFLFISWYRSRSSQKSLIGDIRDRMQNGNGNGSN